MNTQTRINKIVISGYDGCTYFYRTDGKRRSYENSKNRLLFNLIDNKKVRAYETHLEKNGYQMIRFDFY